MWLVCCPWTWLSCHYEGNIAKCIMSELIFYCLSSDTIQIKYSALILFISLSPPDAQRMWLSWISSVKLPLNFVQVWCTAPTVGANTSYVLMTVFNRKKSFVDVCDEQISVQLKQKTRKLLIVYSFSCSLCRVTFDMQPFVTCTQKYMGAS